MNKKLLFIVNCPRSGSNLLLSFLCGLPNTKILYESKVFLGYPSKIPDYMIKFFADYFDYFEEDIVVEKTSEHVFHLEDIERLRNLCKRDIHVVYILRPPVPTILSLLKSSKSNPELFGKVDLLGACEKYEESLVAIYNNLIIKHNNPNYVIRKCNYLDLINMTKVYNSEENWPVPYSFCVSYRELIENPYEVLKNLVNNLYIEADVQSLIDNRISNINKYLPHITKESHHVNVLREIEEVEKERTANITKQIEEGFSKNYIERSNYIRNYSEHPLTKETMYDLIVQRKVVLPMQNPEVYVIVPLCNKQDYIEETLTSIANQTYKNIRVIVIDDCSTDKSAEVAERFIESLSNDLRERFSLIRYTSNQGVSSIRNKGLSLSTDIISFCDADDIWDKDLVQKSVDIFTKYPYIDCVYSRVLINKNDVITKIPSKICQGNVFKDAIQYNFLNCGSNLFIKRQVIEDNDIEFDLAFNGVEDWDFLIQLSKVALFKCTKEYLVTYRQLPNSLSSNSTEQVNQGKTILSRYVKDKKEFSKIFTRLFLYYFSYQNLTWRNVKDLDFRFILGIVLNKLKSCVKSCIS